jgi:5-formyltetrahydrofolate cyclo-ligase
LQSSAEMLRSELRRQARGARRALDESQRSEAASALGQWLETFPAFMAARRIGCYAAVASELDLAEIMDAALQRGQEIYLPHVEHTAPDMRFALWSGQQRRMMPNRFGIPEPLVEVEHLVSADSMDVILLPLLAFDRRGNRLGSGAGYYDRALAFRRDQRSPPWLIGIGFACQEVPAIPMADWDVPLDFVATENELIAIATVSPALP